MERHFILPVTIGAVIHAVLLFGFRSTRVTLPLSPKSAVIALTDAFLVKDPEPPPERSTDASEPPPKGSPEAPRPTLEELPAVDAKDGLTIVVPPTPAVYAPGIMRIESGPIGVFDGVPGGVGSLDVMVGVTGLDKPPHARFQSAPPYPFEARRNGQEGTVMVEFVVDESGQVREPRVVSATDRIFEETTLRAVAKWRFEPGRRGGQIVRFRMAVPVVFNLNHD